MNSIVVYYSPTPDGPEFQPIGIGEGPLGYIRTELHPDKDAGAALDNASPRKGETVLNSVLLPEPAEPKFHAAVQSNGVATPQ